MSIHNLLPPGFQTDSAIVQAVGSGIDSISSGIQSAAQASGPAEVSDWLDAFDTIAQPVGSEPAGAAGFADAGAISSAEVYFRNAGEAGDINRFSDLVPMDGVATKLSDTSFDYQSGLQSFADVLKNLDIGTNLAQLPSPLEDASARLESDLQQPGEANQSRLPGNSEQWIDSHSFSNVSDALKEKWIDSQSFQGVSDKVQEKWIDSSVFTGISDAVQEKWIDSNVVSGISDAVKETWIEFRPDTGGHVQAETLTANDSQAAFDFQSISDSEISERLQYLQGSLQEILGLNQGK